MSEMRDGLHQRIWVLLYFANYLNNYITNNCHMFSESFVEDFFNWYIQAIDFVIEQRDASERLNLLL